MQQGRFDLYHGESARQLLTVFLQQFDSVIKLQFSACLLRRNRTMSDDKNHKTGERLKTWFAERAKLTVDELVDELQFGVELEFDEFSRCETQYDEDDEPCGEEWGEVYGWNHCEDGTSGIVQEYQTDRPCDLPQIFTRVDNLLNGQSWSIPTDGSCHVHVSIPGMFHRLSPNSRLGQCILAELFSAELVATFPKSLYDRWENGMRYFYPTAYHNSKFTALHSHSQGSLEFRMFGHCQSRAEIKKCIELAGIAFVRGYRRFLAGQFVAESIEQFRQKIAICMREEGSTYNEPSPYTVLEFIGGGTTHDDYANCDSDCDAISRVYDVFQPHRQIISDDCLLWNNGRIYRVYRVCNGFIEDYSGNTYDLQTGVSLGNESTVIAAVFRCNDFSEYSLINQYSSEDSLRRTMRMSMRNFPATQARLGIQRCVASLATESIR